MQPARSETRRPHAQLLPIPVPIRKARKTLRWTEQFKARQPKIGKHRHHALGNEVDNIGGWQTWKRKGNYSNATTHVSRHGKWSHDIVCIAALECFFRSGNLLLHRLRRRGRAGTVSLLYGTELEGSQSTHKSNSVFLASPYQYRHPSPKFCETL